jgi:hypothetical protein
VTRCGSLASKGLPVVVCSPEIAFNMVYVQFLFKIKKIALYFMEKILLLVTQALEAPVDRYN